MRYAVDHHQGGAAAEGLAGVAELLPAGRVGGDQVAQHLAVVAGDGQLFFDLLAGDDGDLLRRLAELTVATGGADGHGLQFQTVFGLRDRSRHGQAPEGDRETKAGFAKH
ncbi:hypothetical protein D9M68_938090 [compost metagenome]